MRELKLQPENTIVDIPDLNRFQIGDHVIVDANADYDRFEGVIIGIELRRMHGSDYLVPSITILHDGCVTDEFKPNDCRKVEVPAPAELSVGWRPVSCLKLRMMAGKLRKDDPADETAALIDEAAADIERLAQALAPAEHVKGLDDATKQKLREALRFAASRSVMSSEDERRILAAFASSRDVADALSAVIEGWEFWEVAPNDREPPRDAIRKARATLSSPMEGCDNG